VQVSAETMRRWLHELGWVWKRAKLAAKDLKVYRMSDVLMPRAAIGALS